MAGDWIKMRGNLWDDPRVGAIVDATDASEAAVVGSLYWLWATADQHTEDGLLPGLTLRQIDRKTGVPGFAAALVAIGWVIEEQGGIRIVKFEEHNGASAKKRCQTAKRVAKHGAKDATLTLNEAEANAQSVSTALTRDREEIEKSYSVPIGTGGAAAVKRQRTPREHRKSELWSAIKTLLVDSGESKDLKAAGAVVTKTIVRFDEPTALAGIEATLFARPAGVIAYLEGACQQASGQRLNKQETLEAGNLAAAERFAEME